MNLSVWECLSACVESFVVINGRLTFTNTHSHTHTPPPHSHIPGVISRGVFPPAKCHHRQHVNELYSVMRWLPPFLSFLALLLLLLLLSATAFAALPPFGADTDHPHRQQTHPKPSTQRHIHVIIDWVKQERHPGAIATSSNSTSTSTFGLRVEAKINVRYAK